MVMLLGMKESLATNTWLEEVELILPNKLLNVGGKNRDIPTSSHFSNWEQIILDLDPSANPDVLCDARNMQTLESGIYDAVHCSHMLEHFHLHEIAKILDGFAHVLKSTGYVEVWVSDILAVMRHVTENNLDLHDTLYNAPTGAVDVIDVLYGWQKHISLSRNEFYSHKAAFSPKTLSDLLNKHGFRYQLPLVRNLHFDIGIAAFKQFPTDEQKEIYDISDA